MKAAAKTAVQNWCAETKKKKKFPARQALYNFSVGFPGKPAIANYPGDGNWDREWNTFLLYVPVGLYQGTFQGAWEGWAKEGGKEWTFSADIKKFTEEILRNPTVSHYVMSTKFAREPKASEINWTRHVTHLTYKKVRWATFLRVSFYALNIEFSHLKYGEKIRFSRHEECKIVLWISGRK